MYESKESCPVPIHFSKKVKTTEWKWRQKNNNSVSLIFLLFFWQRAMQCTNPPSYFHQTSKRLSFMYESKESYPVPFHFSKKVKTTELKWRQKNNNSVSLIFLLVFWQRAMQCTNPPSYFHQTSKNLPP